MCHPATCPRDCAKDPGSCVCDRLHDQLVDLIESGVDQVEASHRLYGGAA